MLSQWLQMEYYRLDCVDTWEDGPRNTPPVPDPLGRSEKLAFSEWRAIPSARRGKSLHLGDRRSLVQLASLGGSKRKTAGSHATRDDTCCGEFSRCLPDVFSIKIRTTARRV
jgi:hypothetical protein